MVLLFFDLVSRINLIQKCIFVVIAEIKQFLNILRKFVKRNIGVYCEWSCNHTITFRVLDRPMDAIQYPKVHISKIKQQ